MVSVGIEDDPRRQRLKRLSAVRLKAMGELDKALAVLHADMDSPPRPMYA